MVMDALEMIWTDSTEELGQIFFGRGNVPGFLHEFVTGFCMHIPCTPVNFGNVELILDSTKLHVPGPTAARLPQSMSDAVT